MNWAPPNFGSQCRDFFGGSKRVVAGAVNSFGGGLEQNVAGDGPVMQRDHGDRRRHGEDDMEMRKMHGIAARPSSKSAAKQSTNEQAGRLRSACVNPTIAEAAEAPFIGRLGLLDRDHRRSVDRVDGLSGDALLNRAVRQGGRHGGLQSPMTTWPQPPAHNR